MILGQDHGQVRYGLMPAAQQPAAPEPPTAPSEPEVFIPAQTVMDAPVIEVPATDLAATDPVVTAAPVVAVPVVAVPVVAVPEVVALAPPAPKPEPQVAGGKLFFVSATGANVREGPGTAFGVLGSLAQGEQVLVVDEDAPVEGWSRVRLEGDGVEGYIARRLLSELP